MKRLAALIIVALVVAPAFGGNGITVTQLSPRPGSTLSPGQLVQISWRIDLPWNDRGSWCEQEIYLSTNGGKTFDRQISPSLNTMTRTFNWTVPNTPAKSAVLDIRYGCEMGRNLEVRNPQPAGAFRIGPPAPTPQH
jgi:hypothetical protein